MLTIERKTNESLYLYPFDDIDPDMTVAELFKDRDIIITIEKSTKNRVKLSIIAPDCINVARKELLEA